MGFGRIKESDKFVPVSDEKLSKLASRTLSSWNARRFERHGEVAIALGAREVWSLVKELQMYRTLREGILIASEESLYHLKIKEGEAVYKARRLLVDTLERMRRSLKEENEEEF